MSSHNEILERLQKALEEAKDHETIQKIEGELRKLALQMDKKLETIRIRGGGRK